jgi:N-acetylmuramoyl-L-alanine amidase
MQKTIPLLALCSLFFSAAIAQKSNNYLKVTAQANDNITSLLRDYRVSDFECDVELFYEINNLEEKARLKRGKIYLLPVLIYPFNDKNIRTSIGSNDLDAAKRIEKYNEKMVARSIKPKLFKEDGELWVPYHEIKCGNETIRPNEEEEDEDDTENVPSLYENIAKSPIKNLSLVDLGMSEGRKRMYSIFGKEHEYIPLKSSKLMGKIFYIDSGHGGPDPGAVAKHNGKTLCEDEYNYDVGLRLCRNLIANGATAYMIVRDPNDGLRAQEVLVADDDEFYWGNIKMFRAQKSRLVQRSNVVNKLYEKHRKQGIKDKDQKLIIIHIDSQIKSLQTDIFFYYEPNNKDGKELAQQMHQKLTEKYTKHRGQKKYKGTVTARDLHMLRECKPAAVFIELGNLQNAYDLKRFLPEANRQAMADWLYEGMMP